MNYLSKNIRYLRKQRQWSQGELARHLQIKRGNIAAYESKNVEPKLGLLVKIAELFDVQLEELINKDLENQIIKVKEDTIEGGLSNAPFSPDQIEDFSQSTNEVREILNGLKAFYLFRKKQVQQADPTTQKLSSDIENLLLLMDHLLVNNENMLNKFNKS
jgi:transcriptional regulator with XRE-family HTH domain